MLLILTLFQDNDGWRLSAEGHLGVCFGSMALMAISEKCGSCVRCLALCEAVTGRREAVMYLFELLSITKIHRVQVRVSSNESGKVCRKDPLLSWQELPFLFTSL